MTQYVVVNIGCIECGVSTNIVGYFDNEEQANKVADILNKKMSWRDGGQNIYEVFPLGHLGEIHHEYIAAIEEDD